MGDGPQQVGPQLLVLRLYRGLLLFQGVPAVFNGQAAFAQDGQQHAAVKGVQRLF